jgi:hypothetical protein
MNMVTAFPSSSSFVASGRASRRTSTRRGVAVPCQAVRESDFKLVADRTIDISVDGLLIPVDEPITVGEALIVSFPIPGMWIDAECSVTRVVYGRRPEDEGLACGLLFDKISSSGRAALAGFLHGKPPPLPRRGPLARLRRGGDVPRLADHDIMESLVHAPSPFASLADIEDVRDDQVDPVGLLRDLASAWKRLALAET